MVADVARALFAPAGLLLGRLRYAQKIGLVAIVLVLPLGFVTWGYIDIQRSQVAFSARERDGVGYLRPLLALTAATVTARHLSVTGRDPAAAGVAGAVDRVGAVDSLLGGELSTTQDWNRARTAIERARGTREPIAALSAYDDATADLLTLIKQVSDQSNLTLDPDLDTYYTMDALVFELPLLLDVAGRAVDEAVVHQHDPNLDAVRFDLAIASGTLSTRRQSMEYGMEIAYGTVAADTPAGLRLLATRPARASVLSAVQTAETQAASASKTGSLADLRPETADATTAAIAAYSSALETAEDGLLAVRIDGFDAAARRVEAAAVVAVALVLYLMIGYYLSGPVPLRHMVAGLDALAEGDLTARVRVSTRDEVGKMAVAFNQAIGKVREAIEVLAGSAGGVSGSSTELTEVSRLLRSAAEETSAQAGVVSGAASEMAQNVDRVASGADSMSSAIAEMVGRGTADAAGVTAEAVAAARSCNSAVGRLRNSSTQIGSVVQAITGIARQINLLALNAAIEAARAGEAGRGFAVVAGEVKALSEETARATTDISACIRAIQDDTESVVAAIDQMSEIIDRINRIQIAMTSSMSASTAEMSRNVTEVAGRSSSIAEALEAVARRAEETSSSAIVTERTAAELSRTAADLSAVVARFRTVPSTRR